MIGAVAGDIIGSVYEHHPIKTADFPLFHPRALERCFDQVMQDGRKVLTSDAEGAGT